MRRFPLWLRATLRIAESLGLALLAALVVWTGGQVLVALPLVGSALLGLLAGAAALLPTLGLVIADRRFRIALALALAGVATAAVQGLEYARFVHLQRRAQIAADYRASAAEADRRAQAELVARTGHRGPLGYVLLTLAEGAPVAGTLRLHGAALVGYRLAELALCALVAARWAGGPRPAAGG